MVHVCTGLVILYRLFFGRISWLYGKCYNKIHLDLESWISWLPFHIDTCFVACRTWAGGARTWTRRRPGRADFGQDERPMATAIALKLEPLELHNSNWMHFTPCDETIRKSYIRLP